MQNPKKVLVIRHGALGDVLLAQGAFQAIRMHHPQAHIVLLTTSPYQRFGEEMGLFNEVWVDDRKPLWNVGYHSALFQKLAGASFDLVYDLQRSSRTKNYFCLMQIFFKNPPAWCASFRGAKYAYLDKDQVCINSYEQHVRALQIAGIASVPLPSVEWMKADVSRFKVPSKFFLLVPGCSPSRPKKRWNVQGYAKVATWLLSQGVTPVLIGHKGEQDILRAIHQACPKAINLCMKTNLFEIAELARLAVGALGQDTGPMHLVAMSRCPSVILFSGDSLPERSAPPKDFGVRILRQENLSDLMPGEVIQVLGNIVG